MFGVNKEQDDVITIAHLNPVNTKWYPEKISERHER